MNTSKEHFIRLADLSYRVGQRELFHKLNFTIEQGTFNAIVGRSGEGKSSLLYILGGFIKPNKGEYFFQEKPVYSFLKSGGSFRRSNIGFLFQDFRLLPFLNVEQNISFPVLFSGLEIKKKAVHKLMDDLGILHLRKSLPNQISGGEAQRTALGRALILKPKLLLLDEPSGNLDYKTEKEMIQILSNLKQVGLTLICVTHSQEIMRKADTVYRLEQGVLHKENIEQKNFWEKLF